MGGKQSKANTYSAQSEPDQPTKHRKDMDKQEEEQEIGSGTPKTAIIVGAGQRGHGYPYYAVVFPKQLKIVGVCEPRDYHRDYEAELHKIPPENVFKDWKEAVERDKFADSVIICTPDRLHKEPAIAFAKKGYHILLEKPMAVTEEDCREIVSAVKENNVILSVCHVMRYIPWVKKVKEIIDSGEIGEVVNISHTEPVGYYHFAHSFVRGNWHKEEDSSFSLLAKCCHDVDLISYWMSKKCSKVSSFGNLSHFHKADQPVGATKRCLDCPESVEKSCPYSAKKIYLNRVEQGHKGWPASVLCDVVDIENITDALRKGPYGKCVYDNDNDVMSHQVVNMQFEGGATATLQMVAFTSKICEREVKIYGTKGEITVNDGALPPIKVFNFLTHKSASHFPEDAMVASPLMGHGGADYYTIQAFVKALHNEDQAEIETGPDETLASHLLCFAAERARIENRVLNRNSKGEFE
ncbi:putative oxidoreductase YteT isoform X2 [Ruditapes philippinarum]|uniref:putative oxidoreductase YteT isoform X2 n=1 Tax=Ruditapes philippinarum TaxID=129788 RepID=UPI00295A5795|nr:putative oxidoreductase YteT isoform X2 [Ruditapes philippinarum]